MPKVGFESTIPVFEWMKTVHDLDRAAAVIGTGSTNKCIYLISSLGHMFIISYLFVGTNGRIGSERPSHRANRTAAVEPIDTDS
jgi:hypothetical protein